MTRGKLFTLARTLHNLTHKQAMAWQGQRRRTGAGCDQCRASEHASAASANCPIHSGHFSLPSKQQKCRECRCSCRRPASPTLFKRLESFQLFMTAVQLQELPLRVATHNANKGFLIVDPHWDKVTVSNTEIINSNVLAVAQVLAPSLQLAVCLSRIAPHNAAANNAVRVERVDLWYKGATENTEIINSNLIALGQVIAPELQLTAVDNNIAQYHTPTTNLSAAFL